MGKPHTWHIAKRKRAANSREKREYTSLSGLTREQSLAILQRGYVNVELHVEWLTPDQLREKVKGHG
jgi:hypothetical protein